jgi:ATP-binding cassette subfamily C protein
LQRITQSVNSIRTSSAVIDDLSEDLRQVQDWAASLAAQEPVEEVRRGDTIEPFRGRLVLEGVHFSYAPDEPGIRPAVRGVDLTVQRGEFLGICGPTGGGKSTLLDLMVGLLQPTSGRIIVDGRELDAAPTWWWSQLGVVSQQVFLTDDTLRRNIAFGVPRDAVDEVRLVRCVERAQLEEMVADLPHGLDTIVGERGIRLSGGQRQRVAVARALYREPPVIVLDEGTSALDGATEARVIAALDEVSPDRTLIAVAHRLDTLRGADRIIIVAEGRIQASGPYDELMRTSPLFRELAGAA